MKKVFVVMLMAVAFAMPSKAQFKFGVTGGLNMTNVNTKDLPASVKSRTGFFVGPTVKFSFPMLPIAIDAAAVYDQREGKAGEGDYTQTIKSQSIQIPINLRYGVGLGDMAEVFLFAGPQWAINVGDSEFKWNSTDSYSLKKSTFSINVGIGATVLSHIQLTANYNIACGKSANLDVWDAVSNATKSYNSRNNTWQIGAAYLF